MKYKYDYPRPMVCVDCIIINNDNKNVLLIKRKKEPYKDKWALPGGFIEMNETLEQSAKREVAEETGLKISKLNQFYTYGNPNRDPRGRNISVVFWTLVNNSCKPIAGDDAKELAWFSLSEIPTLAFDHNTIINDFIAKTSITN